jgi:SAM-dependent methyltransferase
MSEPATNSTTRFSDRVEDYIRYRPHYPVEILDILAAKCSLSPESVIADVGSGTGILSRLFLENGNPVVGIEPNKEMREAGERLLSEYGRFTSLDARAESTRLPPQSMDFVIAGQAFHWFEASAAQKEFKRILKEDGCVVLIWNDRRVDSSPFLREYEAFLQRFAIDYAQINHRNTQHPEVLAQFFGAPYAEVVLENQQRFGIEGLLGRIHSSSYMPGPSHPQFAEMEAAARALFATHATGNQVTLEYDTRVYFGRLG